MVALLSVYIVTLALGRATIRAVRQAKIFTFVKEGHNIAEAEKIISSLLLKIQLKPITST